jgi:hypothetical protein
MKYKIIRAFIVYHNGNKDTLEGEFETNDLEAERITLIAKYNCKNVYFTFTEQPMNAIKI